MPKTRWWRQQLFIRRHSVFEIFKLVGTEFESQCFLNAFVHAGVSHTYDMIPYGRAEEI